MTYKPVLPSSLLKEASENESIFSFSEELTNNKYLRVGVVLDIIESDNEENQYGLGPEYDVMTVEQSQSGGMSNSYYKNCLRLDTFGGVADYMFAKLRKPDDSIKVRDSGSLKDQKGSIVILLCLDGSSEKAIIIGSLAHPENNKETKKDLGHHLEGEFNGINWQINKDGALSVKFKSATDNKGTPKDEEAGGTTWKIEKDGSFEFTDGNTESIRVDKTTKKIDIKAADDISITTEKNTNITTTESVNITATKDLITSAEGKAAFSVQSTFDITAEGAATVKSQGLTVESKSQIQMKAQSLFQLEAGSNAIIKAPQLLLGPSPAQPALLAYDLITLGTGNLGAPVISSVIAGYSTSVIISS